MATKDDIIKILSQIEDPELRKPLTELDMVRSIEIDRGMVTIGINLTIPGCPLKKKISEEVVQGVSRLEGVEKVMVEFTAMTEERRKKLMAKLYESRGGTASTADGQTQPVNAGDFAARIIAVASGKGGVGKSTVTSNLAAVLGQRGYKVGVLDADVYGFSIPRILGMEGKPTMIDDHIVPLRKDNLQVISMGFFVEEDAPVIWRGPLLHKAINQFLTDVLWDKCDFLFLDLPPGTGDVTLTIAQSLPRAELLVVTTPQPVASHTAGRVAKLAEKTNLRVIGVIENMSYYESNGAKEYIFGKDGGKALAMALKVPFLGEIPIKTEIREASDMGMPIALSNHAEIAQYYQEIADNIQSRVY
ncbi:MAG: P-loop NTPase [candidate division Zixibacteria bacterium]|nr:P-loop NTPase [candidate division Zixibacteria bacterium]